MALRTVLPNGLTVLIQENHFAPVVSLSVWVRVGSADESDDEAGLAHVHEHMIFKGTPRRPVGAIAREVEAAGGDINAYTSFDDTVYYITMAARYFETGLDVLADAVRNATFDGAELEKELEVILEEVKRSNDTPSSKLSTELFKTAYRTHPFRRPIIGYEETIRGFTREKVLGFKGRFYVPENLIVVVAGDVGEADALARVTDAFAGMPAAKLARPARPAEPEQDDVRAFFLYEPVNEAYLDLALHVPGLRHPDAPALDLLGVVLGSGESSRLYRNVKAGKEVVHAVWSYAYTPLDPGIFLIGATLEAANAVSAVGATLAEAAALREPVVSADELEKAKRIVEADFVFERETVQGQARRLGFFETIGDLDFEAHYLERVRRVTPADLARVARAYVRPENLTIGILASRAAKGTFAEADVVDAARRAFATDRAPIAAVADAPTGVPVPAPRSAGSEQVVAREQREGVTRFLLKNGVRVLFRKNASVPLVSMRAIFLGGTRFETEATQGVSHFVAEMLTKGTRTLSAEDFARRVEAVGGSVKGFAGRNSFGATADFLARDFSAGIALLADAVRSPAFDEDEVSRKRDDILFQISRREDELTRYVFDLFSAELYRRHPYRFPTLGSAGAISAMDRDALLDYHDRYARPDNLVLAVVGDLAEDEALAEAIARFGDLSGATRSPGDVPREDAATAVRRREVRREKEQAHLMLGFLGATLSDPDRHALEVLNTVLAGQGGRLFLKLRDEMHLAYSVTSFTAEGVDPGYVCVYIGTSPANVETAVENILVELDRVRTQDVPDEEIARAKRYMIGTYEVELQTNSAQAANFGFAETYGLGFAEFKRYPEKIEAVTVGKVRAAALRFLRTDAYTLAIVRP
jgi:zinc protease